MKNKKRGAGKIITIVRGPMKLKPTQTHKSKKFYNRKEGEAELKSLTKNL